MFFPRAGKREFDAKKPPTLMGGFIRNQPMCGYL
jgi:hypothetical protein